MPSDHNGTGMEEAADRGGLQSTVAEGFRASFCHCDVAETTAVEVATVPCLRLEARSAHGPEAGLSQGCRGDGQAGHGHGHVGGMDCQLPRGGRAGEGPLHGTSAGDHEEETRPRLDTASRRCGAAAGSRRGMDPATTPCSGVGRGTNVLGMSRGRGDSPPPVLLLQWLGQEKEECRAQVLAACG